MSLCVTAPSGPFCSAHSLVACLLPLPSPSRLAGPCLRVCLNSQLVLFFFFNISFCLTVKNYGPVKFREKKKKREDSLLDSHSAVCNGTGAGRWWRRTRGERRRRHAAAARFRRPQRDSPRRFRRSSVLRIQFSAGQDCGCVQTAAHSLLAAVAKGERLEMGLRCPLPRPENVWMKQKKKKKKLKNRRSRSILHL